jgi:hypothetical protein
LTTGHILKIENTFWVCVSPACDMVPSQLSDQRVADFGDRLPFLALKLHSIKTTKSPKDIQSNRYIYARIGGELAAFCVNDPGGETSSPDWHMLYAGNRGEFTEAFHVKIYRPARGVKGHLVYKHEDAEVVAQLRYEYALNLIQRLSGTFTRVGLDFV